MATRSRFLAWELPQTEEPGGLQMGSQRVRHRRVVTLALKVSASSVFSR